MDNKFKLTDLIKLAIFVIPLWTGTYTQETEACIYPDGMELTLSCLPSQNTVIDIMDTKTSFLRYRKFNTDSSCLENSCCLRDQNECEVNIASNFPEYYSVLVQLCAGEKACQVHINPVPVSSYCFDWCTDPTSSCFSRHVRIAYRCLEKQETTPSFPTTTQSTLVVKTTTEEDTKLTTEILTVENTQSTTAVMGATTVTPESLDFLVQVYMVLTTGCIVVIIILLVVILLQSRFKPEPARLEYSKVIGEHERNNNREILRSSITVVRGNDYGAENYNVSENHGIKACVNPVFESADSEPNNVTSTDNIDYELWKAPEVKLRLGTDTSTEEYQKTVPKPKPPVEKKPVAKRANKLPTYENLKIGQGSVIILSEETEDTKDNEFDDTEFVHNSLYVSV